MRRLTLLAALAVVAVAWPALVQADGEAGLVIQHGDGTTETFCVAFTGESASGDALLRAAGVPVEQFSGLVCAVGSRPGEGCYNAGSFESCTCKCSGGGACEYWAFFTQAYGASWVYSARGFTAQRSRDGDLQAWKWGAGGPSSAPAPAATSFEQVCGHAPRGGAAVTATPPPSATAGTTSPSPAPSAATAAPTSPGGTTSGPSPATAAAGEASATLTVVVTMAVTPAAPSPTARPLPPDTAAGDRDGSGSGPGTPIAFGAVVAVLLAAIGGAVVWRRHHAR